ncbi:MAG: AmmeMemoRadiSam system protein B [Candidatus Hodarchaeales archaeon]|jgi:AmmeMemoRadiSam system protein B
MKVRKAVRAGSWYSGHEKGLIEEINRMYLHEVGPGRKPPDIEQRSNRKSLLGLVSPHAGYACSAPTATHGFLALAEDRRELDTVILLGNKHTHHGPDISITTHDAWETPLGVVPINKMIAKKIVENKNELPDHISRLLDFDASAHADEHSIELQVPFLQHLYPEFNIVPIAIGHLSTDDTTTFGNYLADIILEEQVESSIVFIASSDMAHGNYFPQLNHQQVSELDKLALKPILNRDPAALEEAVRKHQISMCGVGPVKVLLTVTGKLGGEKVKLLNYATSGQTCGSMNAVVGYASIMIQKER